jgi:hypothetical protein
MPNHLKEPMNAQNDPRNIPQASSSLEYVFNKLPKKAEVARLWSGPWWPHYEGGTASTRYGSPSPLQKYDQAVGSQAAAWEMEVARQYANVPWAGHCNGLAAAGIMMEEPQRGVIWNGVTFSVTDIKALVTEMWQASGWIVGDRCDRTGVTFDRFGRIVEDDCRDLNPATFHISITNYLGLFGKGLIVDVDNSSAVWNYPIQSFQVLESRPLSSFEANYKLQQINSSYAYNTQAVDFVYVKTKASYITVGDKEYEYILELDVDGKILGGEWINGSKKNHPDFIWRPSEPKLDNPHLNLDIINMLYKVSVP